MSNKEGEEFEVEVAHLIYLEGTLWLCGVRECWWKVLPLTHFWTFRSRQLMRAQHLIFTGVLKWYQTLSDFFSFIHFGTDKTLVSPNFYCCHLTAPYFNMYGYVCFFFWDQRVAGIEVLCWSWPCGCLRSCQWLQAAYHMPHCCVDMASHHGMPTRF